MKSSLGVTDIPEDSSMNLSIYVPSWKPTFQFTLDLGRIIIYLWAVENENYWLTHTQKQQRGKERVKNSLSVIIRRGLLDTEKVRGRGDRKGESSL